MVINKLLRLVTSNNCIIIHPNQIIGNWVWTKCRNNNCENLVGHWSKTGKLDGNRDYRCEIHRK